MELRTAVRDLPDNTAAIEAINEVLTHPQNGLAQLRSDIDRIGNLAEETNGYLTNRQYGLQTIMMAVGVIRTIFGPSPRAAPGVPDQRPTLADAMWTGIASTNMIRAYLEDIFGYRTDWRGPRPERQPNERSQHFIDVLTGFSGLLEQVKSARTAVEATQPVLKNIQAVTADPRPTITRDDVRQVLRDQDLPSNASVRELTNTVVNMRPVSATSLQAALKTITTITRDDVRQVLRDQDLSSNAAVRDLTNTVGSICPVSATDLQAALNTITTITQEDVREVLQEMDLSNNASLLELTNSVGRMQPVLIADLQAALNNLPMTTITREDIHQVMQDLVVSSNASMQELTTTITNMRPVSPTDIQSDLSNINQALITREGVREVMQSLDLASNASIQQLTTTLQRPLSAAELRSASNDLAAVLQGQDVNIAAIRDGE